MVVRIGRSIVSLDAVSTRLLSAGQAITDVSRVVKEVVENSLDAGACRVVVKLVRFGLERIQVEDDGCGIDVGSSLQSLEVEEGEESKGSVSSMHMNISKYQDRVLRNGEVDGSHRRRGECEEGVVFAVLNDRDGGTVARTSLLESRSTSKLVRSRGGTRMGIEDSFVFLSVGKEASTDCKGDSSVKRGKEEEVLPVTVENSDRGESAEKDNGRPEPCKKVNEAHPFRVKNGFAFINERRMDMNWDSGSTVNTENLISGKEDDKLEESSLSSVSTLGFRGEALHALAQVSTVDIFTRYEEEGRRVKDKSAALGSGVGCVTYHCHYDPCEAAMAKSRHEPYHTLVAVLPPGSPGWRSQCGTTLIAHQLFRNLPVRRREAERHQRSHLLQVVALIKQYAVSHPWIQLVLLHQERPPDGETLTLVSLRGSPPPPPSPHPRVWWNTSLLARGIADAYGGGTLTRLHPVAWVLDPSLYPSLRFSKGAQSSRDDSGWIGSYPCKDNNSRDENDMKKKVECDSISKGDKLKDVEGRKLCQEQMKTILHVRGFVWKLDAGGRNGKDWQVWVMDGRLVDLPRWSKALDSAYRSCLPHALQSRHVAFFLHAWAETTPLTAPSAEENIKLGKGGRRSGIPSGGLSYDVNVSPDKREIMLVEEQACAEALHEKAQEVFYAWSQGASLSQEGSHSTGRCPKGQGRAAATALIVGLGGNSSVAGRITTPSTPPPLHRIPLGGIVEQENTPESLSATSSCALSLSSTCSFSVISKEEEKEEISYGKTFLRMQTEEERRRLARIEEAAKKRQASASVVNFTSYVWRQGGKKDGKESAKEEPTVCSEVTATSCSSWGDFVAASQGTEEDATTVVGRGSGVERRWPLPSEKGGGEELQEGEGEVEWRPDNTPALVEIQYDHTSFWEEEETQREMDLSLRIDAEEEKKEEERPAQQGMRMVQQEVSGDRLGNGRTRNSPSSPCGYYRPVFSPFPNLFTLWGLPSPSFGLDEEEEEERLRHTATFSSTPSVSHRRWTPLHSPLSTLFKALPESQEMRDFQDVEDMLSCNPVLMAIMKREERRLREGKKRSSPKRKETATYLIDQNEDSLDQIFRKSFFSDMEVHGQFNLGFIIASVMVGTKEEKDRCEKREEWKTFTEEEGSDKRNEGNLSWRTLPLNKKEDEEKDHGIAIPPPKCGGAPNPKDPMFRHSTASSRTAAPRGKRDGPPFRARRVLMVVDQHASDEKANYERLLRAYVPRPQPLVCPVTLSLGAEEVRLALAHKEALYKEHGFRVGPVEREITSMKDVSTIRHTSSEWKGPSASHHEEDTTETVRQGTAIDRGILPSEPLHSSLSSSATASNRLLSIAFPTTPTNATSITVRHPTRLIVYSIPTLPYDTVHPTAISELLQHLHRYGTLSTRMEPLDDSEMSPPSQRIDPASSSHAKQGGDYSNTSCSCCGKERNEGHSEDCLYSGECFENATTTSIAALRSNNKRTSDNNRTTISRTASPPAMQLRAVWHSLATKACRTSIMIGTALEQTQMERIVHRLSGLHHPWCCPHGRPTLRCLGDVVEDWESSMPSYQLDYYYYCCQRKYRRKRRRAITQEGKRRDDAKEEECTKIEEDVEDKDRIQDIDSHAYAQDGPYGRKDGFMKKRKKSAHSETTVSEKRTESKDVGDGRMLHLEEVIWKDVSAASSFADFTFRFDSVGSLLS